MRQVEQKEQSRHLLFSCGRGRETEMVEKSFPFPLLPPFSLVVYQNYSSNLSLRERKKKRERTDRRKGDLRPSFLSKSFEIPPFSAILRAGKRRSATSLAKLGYKKKCKMVLISYL